MNGILDQIDALIREWLETMIRSNLTLMFEQVNSQVGAIAGQVSKTPASWNSGIYNLIRSLSSNVIMPVAGIIITFVLAYELISMVIDKNNMNDIGTGFIFRYILKACVAVMILSHTFDFTMAMFDIGSYVVRKSGALTSGTTSIDVSAALTTLFENNLESTATGNLVGIALETFVLSMAMKAMAILIDVILYVRIIEIYLYISVSPIPYATMVNREWGSIGNNFIRGLLALAFQGFFIIVCVAIYSILIARLPAATDLSSALFTTCGTTIVLGFSLLKTGSISKAIFNAR